MFWDLVPADVKGLLTWQRSNCAWRCRVRRVRGEYVRNIRRKNANATAVRPKVKLIMQTANPGQEKSDATANPQVKHHGNQHGCKQRPK